MTVKINAHTVIRNAAGEKFSVFCVVPRNGEDIAHFMNHGTGKVGEFPVSVLSDLIEQGFVTQVTACPFCESEDLHTVPCGGDEYVRFCRECEGVHSDNLSESRSFALVAPMGSRTGGYAPTRGGEVGFDFAGTREDGSRYRRHGFALAGICVQVG